MSDVVNDVENELDLANPAYEQTDMLDVPAIIRRRQRDQAEEEAEQADILARKVRRGPNWPD